MDLPEGRADLGPEAMIEGVEYKQPLGGGCGTVKIVMWCGSLGQRRYFQEGIAV
jgi:hypothetical protein